MAISPALPLEVGREFHEAGHTLYVACFPNNLLNMFRIHHEICLRQATQHARYITCYIEYGEEL